MLIAKLTSSAILNLHILLYVVQYTMVPIIPVACSMAVFFRFVLPVLTQDKWSTLNVDLSNRLAPLHHALATDEMTPSEAGDCFTLILQEYFSDIPEFQVPDKKPFFQRPAKTLDEARRTKNKLRKKAFSKNATDGDRTLFYDALHTYDTLRKQEKANENRRNTTKEERHFKSNFWDFSKRLVDGSLYTDNSWPSFSKQTADSFYTTRYESNTPLNYDRMSWFPPVSRPDTATDFNLDPIRPSDIRKIVMKKSSKSAPGPDGIMYGMIKKLPCTHHFMATLFSKVLMSASPPSSWTTSKIALIHKKGDTDIPSNSRMIALASTIGKLYHQILAERFESFVINNNLIDTKFQKAFLQGISGCTDHNVIVHEILSHAKANSKTVHMTWFDLEDAFGSVQHELIYHTLERLDFPPCVQLYIKNLYSSLSGRVSTKSWTSDEFTFKKGIFQGDPLSPLIFILCFDPIVQDLISNSDFGYDLNGTKFITTPFADDFCLITRHKKTHQRFINRIANHTSSMSLKLKPSKCRSLSLSAGSPTSVLFQIDGAEVPTVEDESHKFLGSLITFRNKSSDIFEYLSTKISTALENINSSVIRPEYKIQVYMRYFLPSLRYHLTVNDLCASHLQALDAMCNRYLKMWFGIPRPGTLAFIFMPNGLSIRSISDLYLECHTMAHLSMRNKSDELVNHCIDSRLERERKWTRKKSVTVRCEQIFNDVNNATISKQKSSAKQQLTDSISQHWQDHVRSLAVQGKFFDLLSMESSCTLWRSIIFNLPTRVCKFLVNALGDSLNTRVNLARWGKAICNKCIHCKNSETLHHVLNNCKVFLDQGRYTYRHNSVLKYIISVARLGLVNNTESSIHHDIPGETGFSGGTTIPTVCLPTNLIPDLVIYWKDIKKLLIFELTVPFEHGIDKAHQSKTNKYAPLVSDIQDNDFDVTFIAFEVGSRGFISQDNCQRLKSFLSCVGASVSFKEFRDRISKLAIISSFVIYHAKGERSWEQCNLLNS